MKTGARSAARLAACAALIALATLPAAAADPGEAKSFARFYVVGADGRSVPDPAIRHVAPPKRINPAPAPAPARQPQAASPARDPFAEFRCEQFGFYYTKDGRCVVPALPRRRPGASASSPAPRPPPHDSRRGLSPASGGAP